MTSIWHISYKIYLFIWYIWSSIITSLINYKTLFSLLIMLASDIHLNHVWSAIWWCNLFIYLFFSINIIKYLIFTMRLINFNKWIEYAKIISYLWYKDKKCLVSKEMGVGMGNTSKFLILLSWWTNKSELNLLHNLKNWVKHNIQSWNFLK